MKKFSYIIFFRISILIHLFLFLFSFSNTGHSQCCTYTLSMHDAYGDGWNGGFLQVFVNNNFQGNFYATGYGSSGTFGVCQGDSIKFIYTAGDYENENTYELYDPSYNLVTKGGPNPTVGLVYADTANCSSIEIPGSNPCNAFVIDTGQCIFVDNSMMNTSGISPGCAEFKGGDIWFVMKVPPSGNLSFATDTGTLHDTGIAVWSNTSCTGLRLLGCDDDSGLDAYSFLLLNELAPEQDLYIQVFGYGGGTGSFRLCVKDLGFIVVDSSELPLISIHTLGHTIVNDTKVDARMEIRYNGPGTVTHLTDSANVYNGHIGIEIRGASSSGYPQRPYGLETRTAAGGNNDVSLLGMPEESDWILTSNYNDRSLIRNTLSFRLSRDMGEYCPRTQLCEVTVDSIYKGIYVFCEKIKRDKNRVNIAKLDSTDVNGDKVTGGYILQQNYWTESTSFQSNYSPIDHPGFDVHFVYEYPKPNAILPEQKNYIASFVDSLETALYSNDFTDTLTGYRKYLDVKSFIDYFLLNELARNNDGFKKSVFFHKDRYSKGGKMMAGPVWDFDWAWKNIQGCSSFDQIDGSGWAHLVNDCNTDNYSCGWYIRLLQDTAFINELKCTYEEYRQTIFDTNYIFHYIDSMGYEVRNAQVRHFKKWPVLGFSGPAPEVLAVATTYPAELDTLKHWINLRLNWLDANLPGLCETTTAVHQFNDANQIVCYPNPGNGHFHFKGLREDCKNEFYLYDPEGRIINHISLPSGQKEFDFELSLPGLYFYTISNYYGKQIGKMIVD
ncbi:MAG: CotH kinase family protein [Saprospiraceae bacterium]